MAFFVVFLQLACALVSPVMAHSSNGMDMSMDGAMSLAEGQMLTYLHFTPGDVLWFDGWVPKSTGAMVGTCIGLFLLAVLERWIACIRALSETAWWKSGQQALSDKLNNPSLPKSTRPVLKEKSSATSIPVLPSVPLPHGSRTALPFIPSNDIPRGIMYAAQAALSFTFMLVVMTFQVGFILSVVVGLGVGEALFGRYINVGAHLA
ncbi:CTR copper uptake transporter [Neolentinus lepideus HHB14362 ss-1]|uniref:Copper transport protein n=1 Tax=Neolentinus lepideus HHB14362 ss-1 TaxID=1314782 RepID=A0A165Q084_9AGAM|nr:CTR copper uptake transporter [Neolentinus lepideus HHB14362 ss-1]